MKKKKKKNLKKVDASPFTGTRRVTITGTPGQGVIQYSLNYNNDLTEIGNKNYALQKLFETDFLTVIGNAKLRPSFVIC